MTTQKRQRFIEAYLATWNATRAAQEAGYSYPNKQGPFLLKQPDVAAAIAERMREIALAADEVLARLGQQARADISIFLNPDGEPNWEMIQRYGYLIRRISKARGGWQIELHDAQQALMLIAKAQGLLVDRVQQNQVQSQVNIYLPQKDEG